MVAFALLAVGAATAFAIWLPRYTTSDPNYCLSCHGEEGGLPNRGIHSEVHPSYSQVTCVQCHSRHGQLIFEGYRKGFMAEPERLSPNCLTCHTEMADRKDESGFKFNKLGIRISHKLHLDVGAKCTDCHSNIAHDLKTPATNRPRMEYCAQCHAVQVESCTKCHGGKIPSGAIGAMPPPAGVTGDGRSLYSKYCAECHGSTGNKITTVNLRSKEFLTYRGITGLEKITSQGHGGMPPFGRESGGPLTEDEIRALIAYLHLWSDGAGLGKQTIFEGYCAVCHGVRGDKMPTVKLNDPGFLRSLGRDTVLQTIRNGKGGMPAFSKINGGPLTYEEILSVEQYLSTLAGGVGKDASALYAQNCAACHGESGSQIPTANLTSRDFLMSRGDATLLETSAQGKGGMPAFGKAAGGSLSEEEIKAIIEYLKAKAGLIAPSAPPSIPHSLTGFAPCLNCHGSGGIKPVPQDHAGRTEEICQVCHKPKE
jgi:mono/diheme cytochrome c family protein/nitrate/TMAO reductase-like tetraheme cytochrome c subunit